MPCSSRTGRSTSYLAPMSDIRARSLARGHADRLRHDPRAPHPLIGLTPPVRGVAFRACLGFVCCRVPDEPRESSPLMAAGEVKPLLYVSAREFFALWVCPVGQSSLRVKPMNLGIGVELILAQNRIRPAESDHATRESEDLSVLFQKAPVEPARFVALAILLLPPCVPRNSSPPNSIGTPRETSRVRRKVLTWRSERAQCWHPSTPLNAIVLAEILIWVAGRGVTTPRASS